MGIKSALTELRNVDTHLSQLRSTQTSFRNFENKDIKINIDIKNPKSFYENSNIDHLQRNVI